jgi:hypothetical protein
MILGIFTTTQAADNLILRVWDMADNAPGEQSLFVGHALLPVAASQCKPGTASESGCGIDIM